MACAIFLARTDHTRREIRDYITENYYDLGFTLDEIRHVYAFNESCQETVPQAIAAFLESDSFEDAIRNAISIGGDSDTLAAITGSIAEAFYWIPDRTISNAIIQYHKGVMNTYPRTTWEFAHEVIGWALDFRAKYVLTGNLK